MRTLNDIITRRRNQKRRRALRNNVQKALELAENDILKKTVKSLEYQVEGLTDQLTESRQLNLV